MVKKTVESALCTPSSGFALAVVATLSGRIPNPTATEYVRCTDTGQFWRSRPSVNVLIPISGARAIRATTATLPPRRTQPTVTIGSFCRQSNKATVPDLSSVHMCSVYPSQLLYMATHEEEISLQTLEWLQLQITSSFWDNPELLLEAVRVWHLCGGQFGSGVFLTRTQFEECGENLKDPLMCGKMIVHLASTSIMGLKRVVCPAQPLGSVLNVEELIQKHAFTVSTMFGLRDLAYFWST